MTTSREILQNLNQGIQQTTTRTKEVLKFGMIGMSFGMLTGGMSGGIAIAAIYDNAKEDKMNDFIKSEAPDCSWGRYSDGCPKLICPTDERTAEVFKVGSAAGETAIKDKAALVMLTSGLGGAALGFFAGAMYGYRKNIHTAPVPQESLAQANYTLMGNSV